MQAFVNGTAQSKCFGIVRNGQLTGFFEDFLSPLQGGDGDRVVFVLLLALVGHQGQPDQPFGAGRHSVVWDGTDAQGNPVCSGIYFYRFITPDKARTGKVTLLR